MKYLNYFKTHQSYLFDEDDNLNYLFDHIDEQVSILKKVYPKVSKFIKSLGSGEFKPQPKSKFNLERQTSKPQKTAWNYQDVVLSDNLILRNNPRGRKDVVGSIIKQIVNKSKPDEYIDLRVSDGQFGKHYYMSAKMSSPVEAGKAFKELMKFIPRGSYFGEPMTGSLSTDSFYNILRRVKDKTQFTPEVKGWVKLNSQGKKRFQEFIKNEVPVNYHNDPLFFKSKNDAQFLANKINEEIRKMDPQLPLSKVSEGEGYFFISLPQIFLKVK
jgi:hypothetical protein